MMSPSNAPAISPAAAAAARKAAGRSRAAARARARLLALSAVLDDLAERSCLACSATPPPPAPVVAPDDAGPAAAYASPRRARPRPPCTCDDDDVEDVFTTAAAALPRSSGLDALLVGAAERARVSSGACVCALVYVGRVHAGGASVALSRTNVRALAVAALALAAGYVDRRVPADVARRLSRASGLPAHTVLVLRDALVEALHGHTYISPATFREYDSILDDLVAPR